MVVQPTLTYGALTWHSERTINGCDGKPLLGMAAKFAPTQNACLRAIASTYKATPTATLASEVHVPSLYLYVDLMVACAAHYLHQNGMIVQIEDAFTWVRCGLQ